jgi:hypothetical protein
VSHSCEIVAFVDDNGAISSHVVIWSKEKESVSFVFSGASFYNFVHEKSFINVSRVIIFSHVCWLFNLEVNHLVGLGSKEGNWGSEVELASEAAHTKVSVLVGEDSRQGSIGGSGTSDSGELMILGITLEVVSNKGLTSIQSFINVLSKDS